MQHQNCGDCGDCGVEEGQDHITGCDLERCPICGGQYISCNCDWKDKEFARPVPYIWYPIVCAYCGKLWPELFMVPDDEWNYYIPIQEREEVICLSCYKDIKDRIDKFHEPFAASEPKIINFDDLPF